MVDSEKAREYAFEAAKEEIEKISEQIATAAKAGKMSVHLETVSPAALAWLLDAKYGMIQYGNPADIMVSW